MKFFRRPRPVHHRPIILVCPSARPSENSRLCVCCLTLCRRSPKLMTATRDWTDALHTRQHTNQPRRKLFAVASLPNTRFNNLNKYIRERLKTKQTHECSRFSHTKSTRTGKSYCIISTHKTWCSYSMWETTSRQS